MITLTTENGRIDINPNVNDDATRNNEILLLVSAADTSALQTSGIYDLELISAGGVVSRLIRGDVVLIPEVTR
jgi:hypothetical protein